VNRRNHRTAQAARTELCNNGFVIAHRPPDHPQCWGRPKDSRRFAIAREDRQRSSRFHIVDYPGMDQFAWLG